MSNKVGSKQKNKKKKHQQRRTNSPDEEENDAGEKIITDERFWHGPAKEINKDTSKYD